MAPHRALCSPNEGWSEGWSNDNREKNDPPSATLRAYGAAATVCTIDPLLRPLASGSTTISNSLHAAFSLVDDDVALAEADELRHRLLHVEVLHLVPRLR